MALRSVARPGTGLTLNRGATAVKRSTLTACGLVLGAIAFTGCASRQQAPSAAAAPIGGTGAPVYTITTQATGHASATPDTLDVSMGVDTRAATARAALSANNTKTTALERTFISSGVAVKDLQTAGLSIQPTYAQNGSTITGYEVTNTVQATLHNLKTAGRLIDAAATTVGNAVRIDQMSFSVSDDSAVTAQARTDAVTKAKQQAQQIAKASGAKLARIRTITEQPAQLDQPNLAADGAVPAARSVPILAGQLTVSVSIQIAYDIS